MDNYLMDDDSYVIVRVQATATHMSQETAVAQDMLTRFAGWSPQTDELPSDVQERRAVMVHSQFLLW